MVEKNPLFDFYKELYFHEIDVRENLNSRIQVPLAIVVSLIGALAFMFLKIEGQISGITMKIFLVALVLTGATLASSIYFLVCSWIGHEYSFLPTARDTEEYRKTLIDTYKNYEKSDELTQGYLDEYVCEYYINSSTKNTNCNDKRSLYLHKANRNLVIAISLTALTFMLFYLGNFDKTRIDKPIDINIVNPVKVEN